ncbi:MAG: acyl-CoA dehydrogenase family protein [Dehalococcoidia bacterium]|nr:acyl-CoA dehydrogenase family protein [Dehalococcoidia bacterium]
MDFGLGQREETLRLEVREFAEREIPETFIANFLDEESRDEDWAFSLSISRKLAERGWLAMGWPERYGGRNASHLEQMVFAMEAAYRGIPGLSMGVSGTGWVGTSLMMYGNEEQCRKYLPLISSGSPDGVWCTGYSEPNSGSDFASIRTSAVRQGDEYIVNGQKVWTSCAHRARWCWLAVKTTLNGGKPQDGISLLIVDMKSRGISVNPLLNYSGEHIFNEVFFDNVHVPMVNLVGEENRGWYQLMKSLAYERHSFCGQSYGAARRILDGLAGFAAATRRNGRLIAADPVVRHRLANLAVELETLKMFAYEIACKLSEGALPTYEASRNKSVADHLLEELALAGTDILGSCSQVERHSKLSRMNGLIQRQYLMSPGTAIAAGTDEIEKNIIGKFKLGLPKSY